MNYALPDKRAPEDGLRFFKLTKYDNMNPKENVS